MFQECLNLPDAELSLLIFLFGADRDILALACQSSHMFLCTEGSVIISRRLQALLKELTGLKYAGFLLRLNVKDRDCAI